MKFSMREGKRRGMDRIVYIIILAFILDFIIGDPQNPLHPIRIIGSGIGLGIRLYKKLSIKSNIISFVFGLILSVAIISITYFAVKNVLDFLYDINYWLGFGTEIVLCYFTIAAKALKVESMRVYHALEDCDLDDARLKLSYIVGRDTKNLSPQNVIKATVETIAENLSDGVIAPLLFIYIGGAPLGLAYKAVNTLDSMIGYRNETYEYFGKFAARFDDCVNFIPARISAVLMIFATLFIKADAKQAFITFIKDRYKHKSPNSAQTEAVCAGALGIQLGGDNFYHGKLVHKPTIGEDITEPNPKHIIKANNLMYTTAILTIVMILAVSLFRRFFCV